MNTKHTPGPWKARKGFDSETIEVFAPNSKIKKPFQPTDLAVVQADSREGKANARLIAAAPELLEALEEAETYLVERGVDIRGVTGRTVILPKMRAAIAKATGKEPA
jgi:hypothetical protein